MGGGVSDDNDEFVVLNKLDVDDREPAPCRPFATAPSSSASSSLRGVEISSSIFKRGKEDDDVDADPATGGGGVDRGVKREAKGAILKAEGEEGAEVKGAIFAVDAEGDGGAEEKEAKGAAASAPVGFTTPMPTAGLEDLFDRRRSSRFFLMESRIRRSSMS